MRAARTWIDGERLLPVGVLAGLNLVDEFDRIAFATLTPEIRDAFGTSDAVINSIATLSALVILFTAAPSGRLADRYSRVRLSLAAAFLWGVCSALTGLVPTLGLLVVVRILSGIGRNANEIIHPSLLSDLYPEGLHPRVFFLHRLANPVAQASGVLAGLLGTWVGWEWTFVVLAVPTIVLAGLLPLVPDPPRRGVQCHRSDISLGEAVRRLRGVPSLRRFWATAFFLAAAAVGIFQLISVYFEEQYGFGPAGRGAVQFMVGLGWVVGIFVGAGAAERVPVERASILALICAGGFGVTTIGSLGMAAAPAVGFALVATVVMASGNGVWQAPYFTAVGRIAPAGMSGQAYASTTLFYALGALLSVPLFFLGDWAGYRVGFLAVATLSAVAAALARSVAPLVEADLALRA
ncbi:MAG: MFS transporter [Actinomycetia bacterium]|nr:MFS transporter [Actinomycetes bacterium]